MNEYKKDKTFYFNNEKGQFNKTEMFNSGCVNLIKEIVHILEERLSAKVVCLDFKVKRYADEMSIYESIFLTLNHLFRDVYRNNEVSDEYDVLDDVNMTVLINDCQNGYEEV